MGGMGKKSKAPPTPAPAPQGPFNAAFAGLAGRLGAPPSAPAATAAPVPVPVPAQGPASVPASAPKPAPPPPTVAAPPPPPQVKSGPVRAVVRMERSGRGGKVVTVVEKLGLRPRELEAWLGDLKRSLGCGGVIEGEALVLQGDNRERVGKLLEARGVRKVTVA